MPRPIRPPGTEDGPRAAVRPARELHLPDSDGALPAGLGVESSRWARQVDRQAAGVMIHPEYETRHAATAESPTGDIGLREGKRAAGDPEGRRARERWVKDRLMKATRRGRRDQTGITAAKDLSLCRSRSRWFDKLCRELKARAK